LKNECFGISGLIDHVWGLVLVSVYWLHYLALYKYLLLFWFQMRLRLILAVLFVVVQVSAKPIQDIDSIGPSYKQLTDSADGKLKFVEQPGNGKFREEHTTADPMPTIQLLATTASVDSKLDEEIDSASR
jgi:hypothetical protein